MSPRREPATIEWPEALDRFAERTRRYQAVLEQGTQPPDDRWPPPDLTSDPLPTELADRARALVAEARRVEAALAEALSHRRSSTATVGHRRSRRGRSTMSTEL